MLFRETAAVYCENHIEHTNPVRTEQETHYISATETNRIMLFGETVAVYCENHSEHTNPVRTEPETHYGTVTEFKSCGICGGRSDTGACFHLVLRFPLPILIPMIAPHSSSSRAGTIGRAD
jgi:hypothetical protein